MEEWIIETVVYAFCYAAVLFVAGFTNWLFYHRNKKDNERLEKKWDGSIRTDKRKIIVEIWHEVENQNYITPEQKDLLISAYRDYALAGGNSWIEDIYEYCLSFHEKTGVHELPKKAQTTRNNFYKQNEPKNL